MAKPSAQPRSEEGARWSKPLALPGATARRRLVSFSPKLDRRVVLANYLQRKVWLILEANPDIASFCERPAFVDGTRGSMIDFWVRYANGTEEFWRLGVADGDGIPPDPSRLHGLRVRWLDEALLHSLEVPIANWERIVAQVTVWRRYRDPLLEQRIVVMLGVPMSLADVVSGLGEYDRPHVEGALFHLLAKGRVCSPELGVRLLNDSTVFRRP